MLNSLGFFTFRCFPRGGRAARRNSEKTLSSNGFCNFLWEGARLRRGVGDEGVRCTRSSDTLVVNNVVTKGFGFSVGGGVGDEGVR